MLDTDSIPPIYPGGIQPRVLDALADTPVVLLSGPRQAGKTTLVRHLAGSTRRYVTLDDEVTCLAAKADPVGLIRSIDSAVIDEIQRAPDFEMAMCTFLA